MTLVNNISLEAINTALLSITQTEQNKGSLTTSEYSEVNDIGSCILYCGDVDTQSTDRIEVFDGWLLCNHAEITVNDHYELFKKIGRKFGNGDGNTTFNLPNYTNLMTGAVYIIKYK
jgi:hypothetical protein